MTTTHAYPVRVRRSARRSFWTALNKAAGFAFLLGLIAAAVIGARHYAMESPAFRVQAVRIEGAEWLNEAYILEQSLVTQEDNLLLLDASSVEANVCRIPYVRTCAVSRIFPDTLVIRITERKPGATLLAHNRAFEIDEDGVVLRELSIRESHPGPLISCVPNLAVVEPGQRIEEPALRAALEVWKTFTASEAAKGLTVSEIAAVSASDLRMYCDELSYEIRWRAEEIDKQVKRLALTWETKGRPALSNEYVDLRFGRDVACK